jgi:hypothetical protein
LMETPNLSSAKFLTWRSTIDVMPANYSI